VACGQEVPSLLSLLFGEVVRGYRGWLQLERMDGDGRSGSGLRWARLSWPGCGSLFAGEVEERLAEAGGGDVDGGGGAAEGEAITAPGAEVDEGVDGVEHVAGGAEQVVEWHEPEVIGEAGDMALEGLIILEWSAAMRGAVGGAEALAAFGNAAAAETVFQGVSALREHIRDEFREHGGPPGKQKGPAGAEPFWFLPYIYRIPGSDIKHAKYLWVSWRISGAEC